MGALRGDCIAPDFVGYGEFLIDLVLDVGSNETEDAFHDVVSELSFPAHITLHFGVQLLVLSNAGGTAIQCEPVT